MRYVRRLYLALLRRRVMSQLLMWNACDTVHCMIEGGYWGRENLYIAMIREKEYLRQKLQKIELELAGRE